MQIPPTIQIQIQFLITKWLSEPYLKDKIYTHFHILPADNESIYEIKEDIWKHWSNGEEWEEQYPKVLLGKECDDHFDIISNDTKYFIDFCGYENKELIKEFNDKLENCWIRTFTPKDSHICDYFRLEIITTPDDKKIIGWTVISD